MDSIEETAKSLHKAMRGLGTDEDRLIREIVSHSNAQRQLVKAKYLTLYGKTLEEEIESETSGKFRVALLTLLEPVDEYEAKCLRNSIKGFGTNENVIIQTLCPKEQNELEILKAAYKRLFNREIEKEMLNEEGCKLGRIFRSIAAAGRSQSTIVDLQLAQKEAQELYDAGLGQMGTDETEFVRILCSRSFAQLKETFKEYEKISGTTIIDTINSEMSGDLKRACLAVCEAAQSKSVYFAKQLHECIRDVGTKDEDLIRLLATRSENDLNQIKDVYKDLYGQSLYDVIKSELSGDYEKLILSLIGK